jgi:uncharacterized protein YmfQ (DUF2313 family)
MIKTEEEQAQTIANHMPSGRAFGAKNISETVIRRLLLGLAQELIRVDAAIDLFRTDILPDETEFYIDEWESAVGIPDICLDGKGNDIERRLHIIAKLAKMNVQTPQDFEDLAAFLGVQILVTSGSVHPDYLIYGAFPYTFPLIFYPSERAAHHTIIVTFTEPPQTSFTYTFPIVFGDDSQRLIQCIFSKLKPANVQIIYENL